MSTSHHHSQTSSCIVIKHVELRVTLWPGLLKRRRPHKFQCSGWIQGWVTTIRGHFHKKKSFSTGVMLPDYFPFLSTALPLPLLTLTVLTSAICVCKSPCWFCCFCLCYLVSNRMSRCSCVVFRCNEASNPFIIFSSRVSFSNETSIFRVTGLLILHIELSLL